MGSQPPALEKLFDEWAKKHAEKLSTDAPYCMPEQETPYAGFVRDGIINLESWKTQKVRICFILNEAGGREGMEHYPDNFDLAAEWNERGSFSKFMFKLCVWTRAMQDAFGQPITYKKSDVVKARDEIIRSIAVVNIKKSDGQRKSDFEVLQRFANEDADEIRRELEILNPNIIICCENMKFLREPMPYPPKKKKVEGEEATAENTENVETAPPETVASAETAETAETETPPASNLKYVFGIKDLKQISKFTYLWGSKLVFSLWTPANFFGTISSNTLNYYAIRGIARAALKAFSEKQRKKKIQQMAEENAKKKAERKAQNKANFEAKQDQKAQQSATPAAAPATPAPPPQPVTPAPTPQPVTPVPAPQAVVKPVETPQVAATPQPEVEAAEVKPKTRRTTKKAAEDTATAEDAPKKTTRRTKKAADDTAAEDAPKKTTRRTKKTADDTATAE